jgi:cytochrome c biogenesis protein ResB
MTNDRSQITNRQAQALRPVYRFLGRLDVAAILIFAVLLAAAPGSCFPQLSSAVSADPERLAQWEANVRARYGALTDLLAAVGAFRCFRSPAFLVSLGLLAAATLVCTLNRWRIVWRRAFHHPVQYSDTTFDAAPISVRLSAPPEIDAPHLVRQYLERQGFRVRTAGVPPTDALTGQPTIYLRGDRHRLSPLATLVTHLAVLLLLLGAVLSGRYSWREELTIEPAETAVIGHGSGLALRNEGFAITHYPDGSVAGYEARVTVVAVDQDREAARGRVRINAPLNYGSIGIHLQSYHGAEGRYSVTFLAVRDPGYVPVIGAGFLLLFGLTVTFNFPHCRVDVRIEPEGRLHLVGRADRQVCDFEGEFAALATKLKWTMER